MLRTSQLLCPKASSAFLHTPCTFTSSIFPCAKRVADTNAVSMVSPLSKGAAAQAWAKPTIAKHTHTHTHRSSPHPLCLSAMSCLEEWCIRFTASQGLDKQYLFSFACLLLLPSYTQSANFHVQSQASKRAHGSQVGIAWVAMIPGWLWMNQIQEEATMFFVPLLVAPPA